MFMGPNDSKTQNVMFQPLDSGSNTKILDDYDKMMLNYLHRLYITLNGEEMDLDDVQSAVDALRVFNQKTEFDYLGDLLNPEMAKGCKIPSAMPVPSAAFQLHNCVSIETNNSGNCCFVFNPCFLYNKDDHIKWEYPGSEIATTLWETSLWVNNDNSLDGSSSNDNFRPFNIGQGIPGVYGNYRIVSASIIIKYIGRLDIASGVVGGAVVFDDVKDIGAHYGTSGGLITDTSGHSFAKYGNFDLMQDSFYFQENLALEGIREVYFPIDNSFEEYTTLKNSDVASAVSGGGLDDWRIEIRDRDRYKSGFNFVFYSLGAPAHSTCFKVDVYINYECLPDPNFLNYMPISPPKTVLSSQEKYYYIKKVQERPVTDAKTVRKLEKEKNIWERLKEKFGKVMPSIVSVAKGGLLSSVPFVKEGISIYNALTAKGDVEMK